MVERFDPTDLATTPPSPKVPTAADLDSLRTATPAESARNPDSATRGRERVSTPLNPEDESLPGNARWYGRITDGVMNKWDQLNTWYNTSGDRSTSRSLGLLQAQLEGKTSMLGNQNVSLVREQARHSAEVARIGAKSGWMSRNPIGQFINQRRINYHTKRDQEISRKLHKLDAKITRTNGRIQAAKQSREQVDTRVMNAVHAAETRFNKRLDPVRQLRERIDTRMNNLGESIAHHEVTIKGLGGDIAKLEQALVSRRMTSSERTKYTTRLKDLHVALVQEETSLEEARNLFDRCDKHRARLANAQTLGESVYEGIVERYEEYGERTKERGTRTDTRPAASATEYVFHDIQDEIKDVSMTNEDFIKLWNKKFPKTPLSNYEELAAMMTEAGMIVSDADKLPATAMKTGDRIQQLGELFKKSPVFQDIIQTASGRRGASGFEAVISRITWDVYRTKSV
jgi:hypothetical protein